MIVKKEPQLKVRFDEIPNAGMVREVTLSVEWLASVLGVSYRSAGIEPEAVFRLHRVEESVEVHASMEVEVAFQCSGCAEMATRKLQASGTALFVRENAHQLRLAEAEDADEALENLYVIQEGQIDVEPVLVDLLAFQLEPYPWCRDDCKGLCPTCGVDRNKEDCDCERKASDSKFSGLVALKEKLEKKG